MGRETYGSRTIWTNFALGKSSNSVRMPAVCGGDFNTIRFGLCSVMHFRNQSSVRFQRDTSAAGTPRMSRYS